MSCLNMYDITIPLNAPVFENLSKLKYHFHLTDLLCPEHENQTENKLFSCFDVEYVHKYKVLFFVHRLNELDQTINILRPLLDNFLIVNFFEFVFCLRMGRWPQTAL